MRQQNVPVVRIGIESVDLEAQCRNTYTGPLTLARDLMQIDLEPGGRP